MSCWRDLALLVAVATNILLLGMIPLVQVQGAGTTEQDAGNQTIEESMMLNIPNKEGLDYCLVTNYVLGRNDGLVGDVNPCANSMRPYSVTMNDFFGTTTECARIERSCWTASSTGRAGGTTCIAKDYHQKKGRRTLPILFLMIVTSPFRHQATCAMS